MNDMEPEETTEGSVAGVAASPDTAKKAPRARRTRRITAWVLVVLASLLIPISVISIWAIRTVTNTDQYVATMAPLARNQVIVDHLAAKATDELFSSHIVQDKLTAALPPKAKPIVTPIVAQVHNYVYGLALKVFESPKFGQLWDTLNRHTHDAVIDVLTGKQTPLTQKLEKGGGIVVNVTPALNNIIDQANAKGITVFNPVKAVLTQGNKLGVTVVSKSQVSTFTGLFNLIVTLKWAIPAVALALAAIGIAVAVERRKTLLRMAIGVGLVTLLLLAGLSLGRITFINQAGHSFNRDVAAAVWDIMLRFLKTDLRWMLLITVLVALGAWLAGPARYAVWIRSTCAKGGRWVATQARELTSGAGRAAAGSDRARRTGGWILEHVGGLRIFGVVVAALFLVFGGNLTGWSLLIILIVLAVYLGLLQLVAAWARKIAPPVASPGTA
ncbi:MAG TPA: hypothetical protein VK283_06940 [Acidimicrobiales bacterium]|nr:hypothetical protein [Acidimicrobiales bacterium]